MVVCCLRLAFLTGSTRLCALITASLLIDGSTWRGIILLGTSSLSHVIYSMQDCTRFACYIGEFEVLQRLVLNPVSIERPQARYSQEAVCREFVNAKGGCSIVDSWKMRSGAESSREGYPYKVPAPCLKLTSITHEEGVYCLEEGSPQQSIVGSAG
ncbi:hypothetical protein VNO77_22711 [Canavalia gladiata]|uniref:Uncharacterized protein n=1 Tax=Canavalia gladiata TaxID=3824 RepID=A0AAN9L6J4_CANGL